MANRLTQIVLRAIGLVDSGANQDAHIVLAKRDDTVDKQMPKSMEECMASGKSQEECMKLMGAMKRAEEDQVAETTVTKADVDALQKRLDAESEARKAAEARVQKMEDEAQAKVFIAKAEGFKGIPGVKGDSHGPILRKMYAGLSADEAKEADRFLQAASDSIAASQLLKEVGSAGVAGAEPLEKLNALARAMVQKDGKLTFEQAFVKVCDDPANKILYEQYETDRASAARGR